MGPTVDPGTQPTLRCNRIGTTRKRGSERGRKREKIIKREREKLKRERERETKRERDKEREI